MIKKILPLAVAFVWVCATADEDLVWKDSRSFQVLQNELTELHSQHSDNSALNELWEKSARIAEMNDRCGNISLNEPLDEQCGYFYRVELPAFEKAFQKVSGDLRIASIEIQSDMRKQTNVLKACAEALEVFYVPEAQIYSFSGGDAIKMNALNFEGTEYEAIYNFSVKTNDDALGDLAGLLEIWGQKCGAAALENIKLFAQGVDILNKEMAKRGSSAEARLYIYDVYSSRTPTLQFYHRSIAGGHYELGSETFCDTKGQNPVGSGYQSDDLRYPSPVAYLSIRLYDSQAYAEASRGYIGCEGSVRLSASENFWGRWVWNSDAINCSSVFDRGSKDYWACMNGKAGSSTPQSRKKGNRKKVKRRSED